MRRIPQSDRLLRVPLPVWYVTLLLGGVVLLHLASARVHYYSASIVCYIEEMDGELRLFNDDDWPDDHEPVVVGVIRANRLRSLVGHPIPLKSAVRIDVEYWAETESARAIPITDWIPAINAEWELYSIGECISQAAVASTRDTASHAIFLDRDSPDQWLPTRLLWLFLGICLLGACAYCVIWWSVVVLRRAAARRHLRRRERRQCPVCLYPVGVAAACTECGASLTAACGNAA